VFWVYITTGHLCLWCFCLLFISSLLYKGFCAITTHEILIIWVLITLNWSLYGKSSRVIALISTISLVFSVNDNQKFQNANPNSKNVKEQWPSVFIVIYLVTQKKNATSLSVNHPIISRIIPIMLLIKLILCLLPLLF